MDNMDELDIHVETESDDNLEAPMGIQESDVDPLGHDDLELNDLTKVGKEYAWEVEGKLAEYFNKNARKFIPTKTIKEHILDECPVPSNLLDTPKLDTALAAVIPEGHTALSEVEALGESGSPFEISPLPRCSFGRRLKA